MKEYKHFISFYADWLAGLGLGNPEFVAAFCWLGLNVGTIMEDRCLFLVSIYIHKHICTGLYIRKGLDGVRYVTSGFGTMLIAYVMNTSRLFLVSIMWCVSTGQQKTNISWCDSGHMAVLSRRSRRANTRSYADVWRVANYSPPALLFLPHLCSAQSVGKVTRL